MSINAEIVGVTLLYDGTVALNLSSRDEGPAGQSHLIIINPPDPPEVLFGLTGLHIWGGSGAVYIGDTKFADRIGCVQMRLVSKGTP